MKSLTCESVLLQSGCISTSTLQIPAQFDTYYKLRCQIFGSRRAYFHFVAQTYLPLVGKIKKIINGRKSEKWKIHYQESGQNLLKRNFEPLSEDWEMLRNASAAFGVSMCFLFVLLLELEYRGKFSKKSNKQVREWNTTQSNNTPNVENGGISFFWRILYPEKGRLYRKLKIRY